MLQRTKEIERAITRRLGRKRTVRAVLMLGGILIVLVAALTVLVRSDSISKANYDQAKFTLAADKRKLESLKQQAQVQLARLGGNPDIPTEEHPQYRHAKSLLDEAQRQLDHTVVRAPFNGIVTQVDQLQPGTYLVSQTAALTNTGALGLVSTDNLWIDAHVKETDLTHVKLGDPVGIFVDTYP